MEPPRISFLWPSTLVGAMEDPRVFIDHKINTLASEV